MINIAICGSMAFASEMAKTKKSLEQNGFNVFAPNGLLDSSRSNESGSSEKATKLKIENNYIKKHFEVIKNCEGVLILNYDKNDVKNYIGGNSLMEIGFAYTQNKDIFLLNPIPDVSYKTEIEAMSPIILNGNVENISKYYEKLPIVFVSSENIIKTSATSLALREFNYRFNVVGLKTNTGVAEEPSSIEETYQGALNRLINLKKENSTKNAKMFVSIESGIVKLHKDHNVFGFSVCIIEDDMGKRVVSITTDVEIPKSMTDLVPKKYVDLGVLVQEKFGIKEKDPYVYFTNGKLNRKKLIFNTVVNTLSLL